MFFRRGGLKYLILIYMHMYIKRRFRRKQFCTFKELGSESLHYLYYKNNFRPQYNQKPFTQVIFCATHSVALAYSILQLSKLPVHLINVSASNHIY